MPPRNRQNSKTKRETNKEGKILRNIQEVKVVSDIKLNKAWAPTSYTAFKVLLSARLCAAVWNNISDCDEVYNYWEPTHFLLYGSGFQTWEYSPLYAIRSYAYLWIHAIPGFIYGNLIQSNKVLVFYFLRCLMGFCSALSEVYFYKSVCHHFGPSTGRLLLAFLTLSTGMFISSTAFLPSTFSMYLITVAFASWFQQKYEAAIFATAVSALVGWPFAAILGLPIAYDIIILKKKYTLFIKWSIFSLFLIMIPMIFIDSSYFGKLVVAPFNIVKYNVFTSHGANLYGTEPCTFYFLNGLLNFNLVFLLSLISIPVSVYLLYLERNQRRIYKSPPYLLCLVPMYLWMFVFFPLAHKEERFLFPIYPLLCLCGAFTIENLQKLFHFYFPKKRYINNMELTNWFSLILCISFFLLSLSRSIIVYRGYRAPLETFMEFNKIYSDENLHPLPLEYPVNVCIGKEWYRFPSSFFLPENWNLKFLQSEFKGQLPKPFLQVPNATKIVPTDMNDKNLEEKSRYTDIKNCDYIVDSDYPEYSVLEPRYSEDNTTWKVLSSIPFLDSRRSNKILRAFYIPYFTDYKCVYVDYNLLQRINIEDRLVKRKKRMLPR